MKEHKPDIRTAVEDLLYILEVEAARNPARQSAETKAAVRNALSALIGTRQKGLAEAWLSAHTNSAEAQIER